MIINRVKNFGLLLNNAAEKGILLLVASIAAITLANFSGTAETYKSIVYSESYTLGIPASLHGFTNEFLMAVFFLLVGLEIKREMTDGNLATPAQRILPVVAAIGGVVLPVLIFSAMNYYDPTKLRGWAVPAATDIAFSLGILALFGKSLPVSLRVFLTALAIIDDLIAVIIISLFYSANISPYYLGMIGIVIGFIICINLVQLSNTLIYTLLGIALWYAFLRSGIHASIAGVVFGFCIPYNTTDPENCILRKIEKRLSGVVLYAILPLFAFVNSGLIFEFSSAFYTNTIIIGTVLGLFVGKQLGIFGVSYYLIKNKYCSLPSNSTWRQFYGVSALCGIGFTMSLFIGDLAYSDFSPYLNDMKGGVLLGSLLSAILGGVLLYRAK